MLIYSLYYMAFILTKMCIICDSNEIGDKYLSGMQGAINLLKSCEKHLLYLSNIKNIEFEPSKEKAKYYNMAHKRLVKIRKQLSDVQRLRSGNAI